ncbi:MAG: hypothetical protein F6K23_07010 [Okeania sp. SIO2C9]|uniref:Cys-every-fifth RiPP peptide CefA n=1 Tax=Okeania sp. SIO2C9 TaxID=2607791 RepID=UPI0013C05375|nr:Cys-every-fifth RiPP peptide CefA [Okeania sp. SIO2C9]NEQ72842.1 hypothetical protein [Okeania sp. SIO2C9]
MVEKVVTLYRDADYEGTSEKLGIGRYRMGDIAVGNNTLSSMIIPQGLMAILYENENFAGNYKVFFEDTPAIGAYGFNLLTSSIIIKAIGILIPKNALNFGDTISLKSDYNNDWMAGGDNGSLYTSSQDQGWEKFIVVRAGDTKHSRLVGYGDIVALKSQSHNKYVTASSSGSANANQDDIGSDEKFVVVRVGDTQSKDFVAQGDFIALRSLAHDTFLNVDGTDVKSNVTTLQSRAYWLVDSYINNYPYGDASFGTSIASSNIQRTSSCAAEACGEDAGSISVCAADACGAAACGVDINLVSACGAAALGIGICGADFALVGACGADACGAAACVAAACGAAACGAAACGADACGAAISHSGSCAENLCGADAGGIDACPADFCGANVCGVNLCPADVCAADACAIDVIPIVPGI